MDKSTKKQGLNKTDKEPQVNRKIMDPDRDINKLLENQVTPSTIKILMGQFNKTSPEYKRLEEEYRNFLLQKNTRPGVIRSEDYKKNNKWEEKKAKSYFISTSYRVEKKTPLDISKEQKQRKNKTDIYYLEYDPYKEIYEEQIEEIDQDLDWEQQQDQPDKSLKNKTKEKNYRTIGEEVIEIVRSNQPIITQQINELKRYGLSVVDFAVEPDEKINIIKEEDELTIELIKNPLDDDQIDRTKFVSNERMSIEKPVTVKLVRKTVKSDSLSTTSSNSKPIINKKPAIMNEFNSNQNLNSKVQKPMINCSFGNPGFTNSLSKVSQMQIKQEDLSNPIVVDEIKQPKFVQKIEAKKRLEKYAGGLKVQQDNANVNNVSLRKELGELNRLVNQEKQIRFDKNDEPIEEEQEEMIVTPISTIKDQANFNNQTEEQENEKIFTVDKQPKFVQEIAVQKQLEKDNDNLKEKQANELKSSLKDEIKVLNDLIQQEGKTNSNNQILDDQIQQQRKISDTLFERYYQLTEKEEEMELHLLKKLKSSDNNVIGEYLLEQNEQYQLLLKLKSEIEHSEKSLVDFLKRQVELSQLIKTKHS